MPGQHCSAVSDSTLDTSLWDCVTTASSLGCQPSTDSSATSAGHIRWSGIHCYRPVDVQLTAKTFMQPFLQHFCFWLSSQNIPLLRVLMYAKNVLYKSTFYITWNYQQEMKKGLQWTVCVYHISLAWAGKRFVVSGWVDVYSRVKVHGTTISQTIIMWVNLS